MQSRDAIGAGVSRTMGGWAVVLVGVVFLTPTSGWAHGIGIVDQANDSVAPFQGYTIQGGSAVGQEFVPTLPTLDSVELQMNTQTAIHGSAFVRIRTGSIGGSALATSATEQITNLGTPVQLYHFDFAAPVVLNPGTLHVIEVVHDSGGSLGVFATGFGNDLYAGGSAIFEGNRQPDTDLWFREGIIPEPSSLLLAVAGVAALAGRRRRVAVA